MKINLYKYIIYYPFMVSLLTAWIIQENPVSVEVYHSAQSQGWGYMICHQEEKNFRPLVTYSPVYDSETLARENGDEMLRTIRALDLDQKRKDLLDIIGPGTAQVVQKVVDASRG